MLRVENLTKSFSGLVAVNNVSFTVPTGQMVGIIGRSGAGKSTLLRMINRLADPTSGRILWKDEGGVEIDVGALK
ncbi:MAG: ATP-binding cassette domain-containing protein, partial [Alphaproteobacteria bacterium]|nr:ATP-binding cassette domain-containing protein [Alphaproteobacteria bacterium]